MYFFTDSVESAGEGGVRVDVAFTDASIDLQERGPGLLDRLAEVEAATRVPFARLVQVHGADVLTAEGPPEPDMVPAGDALVTTRRGLGLMVRVADCVPVLFADTTAGVVGAAHAGRIGTALGIAGRTVARMRELGAESIRAWIGPHVCGRCYEVPDVMRAEVGAAVPETWSQTRSGTPALDLGAGVEAQLAALDVAVTRVAGCTLENPALHSHRRDGAAAGRFAGLVWLS